MSLTTKLSREGRRRLTLLNPATAVHDSLLAGEERFPRIVLDQKIQDSGSSVRKSVLRENDFKRFGKLGVPRTSPHGISELPDAEYLSLHDLGDAVVDAKRIDGNEKFLDQVSARLKKDADLMDVNQLIRVFSNLADCGYYDLSLINKVKNEVLYDIEKVGPSELAVLMHTVLGRFNVVSPRLIVAAIRRVDSLLGEGEMDAGTASIVLQSLSRAPRITLLKETTTLKNIASKFRSEDLSFAQLAALLKSLILTNNTRRVDVFDVKFMATVLASKSVSDVVSVAEAFFVFAKAGIQPSDGMVNAAIKYAPDIVQSASQVIDGLDSIARRNEAADIAATMVVSGSRLSLSNLVEAYIGGVNSASVRGLRCHQLVALIESPDLPGDARNTVREELRRKFVSLSPRQQKIVASVSS